MKKHYRETRKITKEENIWNIDIFLNHIKSKSKINLKNLSVSTVRTICMASLITYINLRLSELHECSIISLSSTELSLTTMIYKGE
jgi:hypothetical protein